MIIFKCHYTDRKHDTRAETGVCFSLWDRLRMKYLQQNDFFYTKLKILNAVEVQ